MSVRLFVVAFVGLLVCSRAISYASPLDPTWIEGFWDDDDDDDAVFQTTSFGAAETAPVCALRPHWTPVWIVPPDDERLAPGLRVPPQHPRGPPHA